MLNKERRDKDIQEHSIQSSETSKTKLYKSERHMKLTQLWKAKERLPQNSGQGSQVWLGRLLDTGNILYLDLHRDYMGNVFTHIIM